MKWQALIGQCEGISLSDGIVVAKILEYFPVANAQGNEYNTLFATLLCLKAHLQAGNTCLPLGKIAQSTVFSAPYNEQISVEDEISTKVGIDLPALEVLNEIVESWLQSFTEKPPYVLIEGRLFIQRYYAYETEIARRLLHINTPVNVDMSCEAKHLFQGLFPDCAGPAVIPSASQQPDWQAIAVANALQRRFMVLNGGPGTGKTYTVARLLIMLRCLTPALKVQLVAPTGKAAQRLSESLKAAVHALSKVSEIAQYANNIETEASTIHKVLGTRIGSTEPLKNEQKPLQCGLLVIDEFSMVDTALFAKVLRALPSHARILLIGDSAQLPSVEAGNLLGDLSKHATNAKSAGAAQFIFEMTGHKPPIIAHTGADHIVTLAQNHRSNAQVNNLANYIQNQQLGKITSTLGPQQIVEDALPETSYLALQHEQLKALVNDYVRALNEATSPSDLLRALKQFRILSPVRKGPSGVEQINEWICKYLLKSSGNGNNMELFHGQAIMISENDPSTGLSNGDIGVIWQQENRLLAFIERDNTTPLPLSTNRLPAFETAFALTIHKTQGSEYKKVLVVLPYYSTQGCSRELLYTGVTRAQEAVHMLARTGILQECLSRSNKRDTYLGELFTCIS